MTTIPVPNSFQFAGCEGSCKEHRGKTRRVEVKCQGHPDGTWGTFRYCEAAIEEDKRRGLNPIILEDTDNPSLAGEFGLDAKDFPKHLESQPTTSDASSGWNVALARLRGLVERLRTDPNQIPAHESMGWDTACHRVLALIDERINDK